MAIYGNRGQLGKKGAFEILGAKVDVNAETGLISAELPIKKGKEVEPKADAKAEAETKEGKAK